MDAGRGGRRRPDHSGRRVERGGSAPAHRMDQGSGGTAVSGYAGSAAKSWTLAPAPAVRRLAGLLGSGAVDGEARFPLLSEWLRLAAARGVRVPPELLPGLLDAGRQRTGLRPLIADAGGARAGWLAAQRAEWGYLAGTVEDVADDPAVWSEGTPGQRAGYLRAARRRGPDEARELLVAEWAALPPEERAQLVEALGVGLGPADEEFLEAALDDRRAAVRSVAATLLGRLPGSGYVARMTERARACLRVADGQATVTAPETCDKAMRRDGIAAKPPSGIGERAWWLEEILARAPLSTWDPAMRDATIDDGWSRAVYRGLGRAAAAQQDPDWAAALVPKLGPRHGRPDCPGPSSPTSSSSPGAGTRRTGSTRCAGSPRSACPRPPWARSSSWPNGSARRAPGPARPTTTGCGSCSSSPTPCASATT